MESSEILVHVSAPSTSADDARYRAQVQAILGFQPVSCQVITLRSDEDSGNQSQRQGPDRPHADDVCHRDADAHASPSLPCTSQSASDLDPHVIPSPNIPSTAFAAATEPSLPGAAQDSLGSPVSVIPDSQPERPVSDKADFESSGQYQRTSSPDSSSPPPSKRRRISPEPNPDHLDEPPPAEREGTDKQEQAPQEHPHQSDDAPPSPIPNPLDEHKGKDNAKPSLPPASALDVQIVPPMQIRPPPPPISNKKFSTHITPTLAMLFNRLHSPRIYTPTQQSRSLDILERGYWYLRINILRADTDTNNPNPHPNTWDRSLFNRFWSFLRELIGKEGRAGWGVWCLLEDIIPSSSCSSTDTGSSSSSGPRPNTQTDSSSNSFAHELTLKVYAWGEIAVHVYLLLFLASERRVRKMGAQWRDGSDEVVIRMPGSTTPSTHSTV